MTTAEWLTVVFAALAAIGTLGAAWAAAISAKASRDTARILQAEHEAERVRRELEPLLNLQRLLEEFIARIPEQSEGGPEANELQRRVEVALEHPALRQTPLSKTLGFADGWEGGVATVDDAQQALREVSDLIHDRG